MPSIPFGTVEYRREYQRIWRAKNIDSINAKAKIYREINREKKKLSQRAYRAKNVDAINDKRFKKDYGISLLERNTMFEKQGKVCAICGADKPGGKIDWRTDHCHKTKKFRGVLCHNCNVGLGHFQDSVELLEKVIAYLRKQ